MTRNQALMLGIAAVLAETALWHAPLGAADRLSERIEAAANAELKHLEMTAVTARVDRSPLRRRIVLSGQADDFQHRELVRIIGELPGVSGVRWASPTATTTESVK